MQRFMGGFSEFLAAFRWWRLTPKTMMLGIIPVVIVSAIFYALLVTVLVTLTQTIDDWTPWADGWPPVVAMLVRTAITIGVTVGLLFIVNASIIWVATTVFAPMYDRLWAGVELRRTGGVPHERYGFGASFADGFRLIVWTVMGSIVGALIGLVPIVGSFVGAFVAMLIAGWGLAVDMTSRALTNRGMQRAERKQLLRTQRARVLGFGLAAQLGTMIPLVQIVTLPTAVAGGTTLAQDLLAQQNLIAAPVALRSIMRDAAATTRQAPPAV